MEGFTGAVSRRALGRSVARLRERVTLSTVESAAETLFVPALIALLFIVLSLTTPHFFTSLNITNILVQASVLAIIAFGATFVILSGELDISMASVVALVSVVAALVMQDTGSIVLGVAAGVLLGGAVGAINGLVTTLLRVPSFIATLAMLIIAQGLALGITNGSVVAPLPDGVIDITDSHFAGIRMILWITIVVFFALLFLQRTVFGVRVLAVGGDRDAARLAGVYVDRVRFMCLVISGTTAGIAGVVLTARVASGNPTAGGGGILTLTAVAAIVIGGNYIFGGRGSVARTLAGVVLVTVIVNGLQLNGIREDIQQVTIGCVLILATSVDALRAGLRRRARSTYDAAEADGDRRSLARASPEPARSNRTAEPS